MNPIKNLWQRMKRDYFTRSMVMLVGIFVGLILAVIGTTLLRWLGVLVALAGFAAKSLASVPSSDKTDFLGRKRRSD